MNRLSPIRWMHPLDCGCVLHYGHCCRVSLHATLMPSTSVWCRSILQIDWAILRFRLLRDVFTPNGVDLIDSIAWFNGLIRLITLVMTKPGLVAWLNLLVWSGLVKNGVARTQRNAIFVCDIHICLWYH